MAKVAPRSPKPRLLADIGGTKARFALQEGDAPPERFAVFADRDYPDLAGAVEAYLDRVRPAERPPLAAFAVASPVVGDRIEMTNNPWSFSIEALRRELGLERLVVINDFSAIALSVPELSSEELDKIGGGAPVPETPIAVLGPGTGLGVSALIPAEDAWIPLASEGGHATLSPADDRESEVLALMRRRFGHVSAERVISGQGLVNLFEAVAELERRPVEPVTPEDVTRRALDGACEVSRTAVAMFCAMLGTMAGNLALTIGSLGGVYVAGGIVPRLGETFAGSAFRQRFEDKGRFSAYLARIPTYVIMHEAPAFLGLKGLLERSGG